jgi:hypothetical protein
MIRRVGKVASPLTWDKISLALCSNEIPSLVRLLVRTVKVRLVSITGSPNANGTASPYRSAGPDRFAFPL